MDLEEPTFAFFDHLDLEEILDELSPELREAGPAKAPSVLARCGLEEVSPVACGDNPIRRSRVRSHLAGVWLGKPPGTGGV